MTGVICANRRYIHYNPAVQRLFLLAILIAQSWAPAGAQQAEQPQQPSAPAQQNPQAPAEQSPPVQINYLNVCTPSDGEKDEIASTLARVPNSPVLVADFEIVRGQSSSENAEKSRYVRLRREFPPDSKFSTVQYSISNNGKNMIETLVLTGRDVKDLRQISIEDNVSSHAADVNALLTVDTPASRVKVERFGKTSVALARCEGADQSKYAAIFSAASSLMASYRKSLALRTMLGAELKWLASSSVASPASVQSKLGANRK